MGAGVGEIGQSFLASNRISGADPELGQGVICLTGALGMSLSGGGLDPSFWGFPVGFGTSANCPLANLYAVTGIGAAVDLTMGIWVEAVAIVGVDAVGVIVVGTVGVGTGWARTLALYPLLVIMALFLLSFALGPGAFSNLGVGAWLGWSQLGMLQMALLWLSLGCGFGLWTKLPF